MGNREWRERLSSFVVYAVHGVSCINTRTPPRIPLLDLPPVPLFKGETRGCYALISRGTLNPVPPTQESSPLKGERSKDEAFFSWGVREAKIE